MRRRLRLISIMSVQRRKNHRQPKLYRPMKRKEKKSNEEENQDKIVRVDRKQGQVRLGIFALEKHGELAIHGVGRVRTWLRNVEMVLLPRRTKKTFSKSWLDEVAYWVGYLLQALHGPTVILHAQVAGTGRGSGNWRVPRSERFSGLAE